MKVLVANRGEIACRILRTLREMGLPGVAVYTDPDREALHPDLASEAVALGPARGYRDGALLIAAAKKTGADALHPGYGFLAQSAAFARACGQAGLAFIGPSPEAMEALGDKRSSRALAEKAQIPIVPGVRECDSWKAVQAAAATLGYPLLLKASGGGGGRGMRQVATSDGLREAFEGARREAGAAFNDDRLLVERFVAPARHIEVQILGDGREAVAVGERECSLQRRYQKVIEEAPAAAVPARLRKELHEAAVRLARAAGYASAGTVEFLVAPDGTYFFLEVNSRIQVEHPVTEMVTGIDLIRSQLEIAQGGPLPAPVAPRGHAIEARLNAEDAYRDFLPQTGRAHLVHWPQHPGVRIDTGLREGQVVGSDYDSLLAKVIAWGGDREQARRRLVEALKEAVVLGVVTNQPHLLQILERPFFVRGETFTTTLESERWEEPPVPEAAAAAARRELESRSGAPAAGGGDPWSPWATP